ncbi:hypothetical protein [Archangium lipolyticum]|uniref:hypothetical protein n=1 Tax=Archangium lipolyticum TaxID=2970465 RepID=UPI00214A53E4|nr:hypothetical protein [Archangium lipolyticum]
MKRKMTVAAVVAGALLVATSAVAGFKSSQQVVVDVTNRHAQGSLGGARNSADSMQYIGCYTQSVSPFTTIIGQCYARDASGTYVSCSSTAPGFVNMVQSLNGDSDIAFGWDASNTCTSIIIFNTSDNAPKNP